MAYRNAAGELHDALESGGRLLFQAMQKAMQPGPDPATDASKILILVAIRSRQGDESPARDDELVFRLTWPPP